MIAVGCVIVILLHLPVVHALEKVRGDTQARLESVNYNGRRICYSVYPGLHYARPLIDGQKTLKNGGTVEASINIGESCATYLIPANTTNEIERCMSSWNKLYGYSRCRGSLHHNDSDRFVWRRAQSCLSYPGNKVTVKENCTDANYVEIAAYAYDNGDKPFQNQGRLLKPFSTLIATEAWYNYQIVFGTNYTIYNLRSSSDGRLLESQTINHRECYKPDDGYRLDLYFGGVCPAPQKVSACYNYMQR